MVWLTQSGEAMPTNELFTRRRQQRKATTGNVSYDRHRAKAAARQSRIAAAGRDIGSLPALANPKRREACRLDFARFCLTYNPAPFYFPWSRDHKRVIARIEEVTLTSDESGIAGGLYAFAMTRGYGKSTLCKMAMLWATSYAHQPYVYLIGATAPKAMDNLDSVQTFIRFLPTYIEDFPEIAYPAIALDGIAQRANGQLCESRPTMMTWSQSKVVFPTVPLPEGWLAEWGEHDVAPTSGIILAVSGLTGEGIRGSAHTNTKGEVIRPSMVLLDDPQTDESARSLSQNHARMKLVNGAVLGMAGPGKKIAGIMPCTVIVEGDMVSQVLDRKKNPLWRGMRGQMLSSMPDEERIKKVWEPYFEIYRTCAQMEPADYTAANDYYLAHRANLDAGFVASWPEAFNEDEVSAIQSAMNIYCRDKRAFYAEYQNSPLPEDSAVNQLLTADEIAAKLNGLARRQIPETAQYLTAFVDIQGNSLWWAVMAWEEDFSGYVIDYGVYPEQPAGTVIELKRLKTTMADVAPGAGFLGQVYAALDAVGALICDASWPRDDGIDLPLNQLLVDANWGETTDTVYKWAKECRWKACVLPSHGRYVGPANKPFNQYEKKKGERVGLNWIIPKVKKSRQVRHVAWDTNWWKTFVHRRLATSQGDPGSLSLWGYDPLYHQTFADHQTAEYRIPTEGRGRKVDEWKIKPTRPDNHWLDALVGGAVAASIAGARLPQYQDSTDKPKTEPLDLQALQAAERANREGKSRRRI